MDAICRCLISILMAFLLQCTDGLWLYSNSEIVSDTAHAGMYTAQSTRTQGRWLQ